jgi:hypothetical protein
MSRVARYERLDAASLKPPVRMDNGFLRVEGRIAKVGVQEYRRADGTVSRELRLPEEVFHADSLASMAQLPVTNQHPPGMLTAKNARKYTVGSVGENVRQDGDYIAAALMITDADAIDAAEKGRNQLSVGYTCELDDTQDPALVAQYGKYDSIMRNIRGNHVALVDVARAGPGASLRLDSNDAVALEFDSKVIEEKSMHKFMMDGMAIEVSDANHQVVIEKAIAAQKERADKAEKALADANKSATEHVARADVAEAKVKELTDAAEKQKAARSDEFKALLALGAEVAKLGVEVAKLDQSEVAYKTAAVKKLKPSINLDGKGAEYISAIYDLAKSEQPSAVDQARAGVTHSDAGSTTGVTAWNTEEATRRYNERLFGKGAR